MIVVFFVGEVSERQNNVSDSLPGVFQLIISPRRCVIRNQEIIGKHKNRGSSISQDRRLPLNRQILQDLTCFDVENYQKNFEKYHFYVLHSDQSFYQDFCEGEEKY